MIPKQTQEPITTDVPLGLDEPAPILVWEDGLALTLPSEEYYPVSIYYISEDAAKVGRDFHLEGWPDSYRIECEPHRIPLEDALRLSRCEGMCALQILDELHRVVEEYPL